MLEVFLMIVLGGLKSTYLQKILKPYFSSSETLMVPQSLVNRFNNTVHNPIIMKTTEFSIVFIILMLVWVGACGVLLFLKIQNPSNVYFHLIFNSIPIINGGLITPISFYFLIPNLRHFYVQMFWENAPQSLQRFNPSQNLLPKNSNNRLCKTPKPEIFTIVPSEEDIDSTISNRASNNGDNFDSDNWWKKSSPGPSHQECSGNQQWFCEVHKVPLK